MKDESVINNIVALDAEGVKAGAGGTATEVKKREKRGGIYEKLPRPVRVIWSAISRNWIYIGVTLVIFALFFGILYSFDIYPFGSDNMSNYDLLAQIVPFYEHFYDVFDGKSGLMYSPAIAGGADVFGTLAYCGISPFTPLFLLFGRTRVYNAISFILPLKLSAIACAAVYFIKKTFPNVTEIQTFALGVLYAFCGYTFVANTYVNWLDFLIYMPFVIMGFRKLVGEGKVRYFAISYALMIYACFSIACFALFLVFPIMAAYCFIVCERGKRLETFSKCCLSLVLAVALAMPLLVPALFAYMRSGRNTGLFENINNALDSLHIYRKVSYILSDTAFVFFTVIYFLKNGFKDKFNRFLLLAGVLLLMPIFIDEVCNLMNAGSYMSYSERFGFLNSAYALYVACRLIYQSGEKSVDKRVNVVSTVVMTALAVLGAAFIIIMNLKITDPNVNGSALAEFSGNFAHSLGGLEVIYQISLVVAAVLGIGSLLYAFRLIKLNALTFSLVCLLAVQVAFYNIHLVSGNAFNPLRYDQYNAIMDKIDDYDDRRYFRVKDNNSAITNDAALNTHTNSFGVFSSVIDGDNFVATNFFGYDGNRKNSIESSGGNMLGDCLLGYKYFYVHTDDTRTKYSVANRDYLVRLDDTAQPNFCGYENVAVFPNAFVTQSGQLKMDSGNKIADYEELYAFLGGEDSLFATSYFTPTDERGGDKIYKRESGDGRVCYTVEFYTKYVGEYFFEINLPEGVRAKYNTSTSSEVFSLNYYELDNPCVWLNYSKASSGYFHLNLMIEEGSEIDENVIRESVKGRIMTNSAILALSQKLKERAVSYVQSPNRFTMTVDAPEGGYLFLNYVAIDGFEAVVNGKKRELIDNGLKFLLVELDEGKNEVSFIYKSPYPKYMLVGLFIGVAIIVAVWLIYKRFPNIYKKLSAPVAIAGLFLLFGVVAFFYIYPTSVFSVKLFKLLIKIK